MPAGIDEAPTWIVLVAAILLAAPLAGCLEPIGKAAQDAVTDGNATSVSAETEAETSREVQTGRAADTYEAAFSSVQPGSDEVERVSMDVFLHDEAKGEMLDVGLYWDAVDRITVLSIENVTDKNASSSSTAMMEGLVFGTVNKTTFFGAPPTLATDYNESHSWEEQPFSAPASNAEAGPSKEESIPFADLLQGMDELPEEAEVTHTETTYEGQQALRIDIEHENETSEIDMDAVVAVDTQRPLRIEGTVDNATMDRVSFEIEFAYGERADHAYADELVRLEAMALDGGDGSLFVSGNETRNKTVLPSQNPGSIPLDAVEVHLRSDSGRMSSGNATTEVAMPAEDRQYVTEHAKLAYDDVDGDGAVSPGDEIRFTPLSEEAQGWKVSLHDEETQMYTTPGVGLGTALAVLGSLGLLVGRSGGRRLT